ncbi:DUF4190 domain-containing protein [Streptomyces sp. NPDC048295]|uniref:DUF4190 domain-containing protein n=1 Tax=Streptomyces sp. NPDC048295 TaxID=3154617 RepID=UPI003423709D
MNTQGMAAPTPHRTAPSSGNPGHGTRAPAGEAGGPGRGGMATAAMTLGVIGLFTSVFFVGGLLGVIGTVLGIAGLRTAGRTGAGRGRAITGVVTSVLAIALSILFALFMAWYANKTQECYRPDSFQEYTQCVSRHLSGN